MGERVKEKGGKRRHGRKEEKETEKYIRPERHRKRGRKSLEKKNIRIDREERKKKKLENT